MLNAPLQSLIIDILKRRSKKGKIMGKRGGFQPLHILPPFCPQHTPLVTVYDLSAAIVHIRQTANDFNA